MAVRNLNLHEYQSMEIMKSFGVAVPNGKCCLPIVRAPVYGPLVVGEGRSCTYRCCCFPTARP